MTRLRNIKLRGGNSSEFYDKKQLVTKESKKADKIVFIGFSFAPEHRLELWTP